MNLQEVMQELEALGTAQNRKIYKRHGASDNMFGVSFANLKLLVKKIKKDHALAKQLWDTGNYDAQILGMMIADPRQVTDVEAEAWVHSASSYATVDYVVELMAKTPFAREKAEQWLQSDDEWIGRAGWHLLSKLATLDQALPDTYFEPYLKTIERDIHTQKNRKREAMNNGIIAIGTRSMGLQEKALLTAKNVGQVYIDHGETGCKTPDAAMYINKAMTHKGARAKKTG